jgi:hypothetical protein
MESTETIIERLVPAAMTQNDRVTLEQLATMRTDLKRSLPADALVEVTLLMNTICVGVYTGGKWHRRECVVHVS